MKKYNIIYCDPPWFYNNRRIIRKDGKMPRFGPGAVNHYLVLKVDDIKKINVKNITAENAALFLWVTCPNLPDGLAVLKAWGFEYKTIAFTWIKTNKNNGRPFFGIGYYTKSNAEICLLGIKGKMKPIDNSVSSVIMAPRREHSRKPDEVRDRIVKLFGDLPRIELFARTRPKGWHVWGLETEKFKNEN